MAHLVTQDMCGGIFVCQICTIGMPKIMVFKRNSQFFPDHPRVVLHAVDRLHLAIVSAVHQLQRRDHRFAANALQHRLILFSLLLLQRCELFQFLPLHLQMLYHSFIQVDSTVCVARFQRYQLHYALLILHLLFDMNDPLCKVNIAPA